MSFSVPILLLKYRQFLRIPACCAHTCTIDHPRHMVCRNRRFEPNLGDSHPTERIRRTILLDRQNRFYLAIGIFDCLASICQHSDSNSESDSESPICFRLCFLLMFRIPAVCVRLTLATEKHLSRQRIENPQRQTNEPATQPWPTFRSLLGGSTSPVDQNRYWSVSHQRRYTALLCYICEWGISIGKFTSISRK